MSAAPAPRPDDGWTLAVDTSTVVAVGLAHDGTAVAAETVGDNHSCPPSGRSWRAPASAGTG